MLLYSFCRLVLIFLLKVFFGLRVSGLSNVPVNAGFILASNHTSNLDPMILGAACNRPLNFMAKEDLFRIPVFGRLIPIVGAFPVKRDYVDISAIREAISRLKKGRALVIFPEGTRSQNRENTQGQPGIGLLSNKSNCAILPAFISGADKALPRGSKLIRPAKISVRFGKPMRFESSLSYELVAKQVMNGIFALK